jgi:lipoprotein-anchoring transpeptidase ErfK/SrfK
LYRQSRGDQPASADAEKPAAKAPNVEGLNLKSIDAVFITYTVTDVDLQNVGDLPDGVAAKAKLKVLPYKDAAEAIAEKFHSDKDFLEQLNPGKTKQIKAGDQLMVPNVEPFELAAVKDLKPGHEAESATAANETADEAGEPPSDKPPDEKDSHPSPAGEGIHIRVDGANKMLSVYQGDTIVAAYPVSIGSEETKSPIGEWKVRGVAKMPTFRYDEKVLKEGERSSNFKMLPPGPNSPVGVIWIALNKKAIGLHGTDDPDSIGRAASHGCVRMANWDIVRLAAKVKHDVPVSIQ